MYLKPYSSQPEYTVLQAAALWYGQDPERYRIPVPKAGGDRIEVVVIRRDGRKFTEKDKLVFDKFIELRDAIKDERLTAEKSWEPSYTASAHITVIDWNRTTILQQDLIKLAKNEGVKPTIFFRRVKPHTGDAKKERLKALDEFVKAIYKAGRFNKESWAIENGALPFTVEDFWYVFQWRHPHLPPIESSTFARDYQRTLGVRFNKSARIGHTQELENLLS